MQPRISTESQNNKITIRHDLDSSTEDCVTKGKFIPMGVFVSMYEAHGIPSNLNHGFDSRGVGLFKSPWIQKMMRLGGGGYTSTMLFCCRHHTCTPLMILKDRRQAGDASGRLRGFMAGCHCSAVAFMSFGLANNSM